MMIKKLLLLLLIPLMCAATYSTDFEDGTTGNEYNSGYYDGSSRAITNEDHTYGGSKSCRVYFPQGDYCESSKIEVIYPEVNLVDGTTTTYCKFMMYLGTSADNPSGEDWSWAREDTSQAQVIKWARFHKSTSGGVNWGWNSIYGTTGGAPRLDLEYAGGNVFQDSPYVYFTVGSWYKIEFWCLYSSSSSTGRVKFWINDVLKIDEYIDTMEPEAYKTDFFFFGSYWNGRCTKNQYVYLDDFEIKINEPLEGGGDPDDTPPLVISRDPAADETGVAIDKDPFIEFTLQDNESGIDDATIVLTVEGVDESDDVTLSGDVSNRGVSLALADVNASITNDLTVNVTIDVDDNLGNSMSQEVYEFIIESAASGADIFATGDMGDRTNYTEYSTNWRTATYGNLKYEIDNSAYEGMEYAIYDGATYLFWTHTGTFTCTDNLATNAYADLIFPFNYVDSDNFAMKVISNSADISGWWDRVNGVNTLVVLDGSALITDNNEHTYSMINNNGTAEFWIDDVLESSTDQITIFESKLGVGSLNDQGYFDDIVMTEDTNPGPEPTPGSLDYILMSGGSGSTQITMSGGEGTVKIRMEN